MSGINKEKAVEMKEALSVEVGDKNGVPVTRMDLACDSVRQQITQLLAAADFEAYEKYRAMKYGDFEPTIEQRTAAYEFAFKALLAATYTKTLA